MAYRGRGGFNHSNSNKRPLGQSPGRQQGGSGFESQFSELASFQADAQQPTSKRQRTNTGSSRISPLKFDNNKFQIVATGGSSTRQVASNTGPKFISKPILPSQKISQVKETANDDDLWGDDGDGCEDLLLAASQVFSLYLNVLYLTFAN